MTEQQEAQSLVYGTKRRAIIVLLSSGNIGLFNARYQFQRIVHKDDVCAMELFNIDEGRDQVKSSQPIFSIIDEDLDI